MKIDSELFYWNWNKSKNLEGFYKATKRHIFTWQPHGSQFTILENVPKDSLVIKIKRPEYLDKEKTLEILGFNKSWITVTKNSD